MADVEVISARSLGAVAHGFLGRSGGVSTGTVSGLNVGFGADDDEQAVLENRRLASAAVLPEAVLVTPYQIHSAHVVVVEQPWPLEERPRADALVTNRPGILLGIVTADCAPVLLADQSAGVIGAAHAGWRGAHDGVIEATVAAMVGLGANPNSISAAIGPCIAQDSYEVDDGFRDQFAANDEQFFVRGKPGHRHFDLEAYVAARLSRAGIEDVEALGIDTYQNDDRFYSYRRSTHRNESNYGRQFSLIGLPPPD